MSDPHSVSRQGTSRATLIGAAAVFLGLGLFAYFLPVIMLALGQVSTLAAIAVAVVFLLAPFVIFSLRARFQKRRDGR